MPTWPALALCNGWVRGLVSIETVVLRRWGVETNVWFIHGVDKVTGAMLVKGEGWKVETQDLQSKRLQ